MRAIKWNANSFGSTCMYFVLAMWGFVFVAKSTAQSGYETYVTYRTATRSVSNANSRRECSGWLFWEDCGTVYYAAYAVEYIVESVTATRCQRGWRQRLGDSSCYDIDECAEGRSGCAQNCSNTIGSYSCSCNASYRLSADERSCDDIDECAAQLDNCTLLGPESFTCENTIGGYQCVCKTGFEQVEPRECRDINECETLTNNCTLYENTTCQNIIGSYRCESGGNRMSESTVTLIIVVTVCAVVGIVLIIIAIVCIVICAKKRKRNKDKRLSNATLPAGNIYDGIKMTSSSTSSESSNQVIGGYKNMAVTTTPEHKHTPVATTPAASESCSGKSDSKETEIGQSTSVNINKNLKELLKAKKAKVDCKDGKATNASIYQDLAATTEKKNIYEAIKNPSNSTHISVQGIP